MNKKSRQKQYIVVGLGRFGRAIAETLCQDGAEVLGVDRRMDVVERLRDELTQTIQMDAMDRRAGGAPHHCQGSRRIPRQDAGEAGRRPGFASGA